MPIYEFKCRDCHRKTTALVMQREKIGEARCRACGSGNLERLWSRFASPKSEDARLEALADPSAMGDVDESDPASVARFMKKMGREMGEDLGDDLDQAIEQEMSGEGSGAPPGADESGSGDGDE
jgi:putative FmdB family regulatory protein